MRNQQMELSQSDAATEKQKSFIRSLSRQLGVPVDAGAIRSKTQASHLIDRMLAEHEKLQG